MTRTLDSHPPHDAAHSPEIAPEIPAATSSDTSSAFDRVLDVVAERRAEFEEKRHVPRDVIAEFKRAGIYRSSVPTRFGGTPLPPAEFLRLIERISVVDGSAGWVASFGSSHVYLAALPLETQAALYADGPDVVFAGGLFPVRPAERVEGGYRVSGRWKFASGCKGADVFGVGVKAGEDRAGRPLTAVLRPGQVEIAENWDVIGMRGTGSHDLVADGVVVPEEWTFVRGGEPTVDEPLYRYPTVPYAAQVLAVVGLGVARAALDHAVAQGGRQGFTGAPKPAERATYRIAVGRAEARLRSARAFFYEATEEAWETVTAGDPASAAQASLLRLAATHLAETSFAAVRSAYQLSGIAAIADGSPMQRFLRDASVVPQHAFLQEGMYDGAGAVLTGVPPFPGYL
ncbi:acyl-CoA dehydrogenase family protein [Streptomyces sp. NPDC127033]|uniref:acyl-CoA dehydrogenase family protein n=1 Tax=Streptomyces sp. NPDC127033 TaxID=3347110 RepID=UPI00364D06AE